jgi:peptide deformylase
MKITTDTILIDPNPLLREKAKAVTIPLSKEDKKLIQAMRKYVHDSKIDEIATKDNLKPAVGLAATQIGVLKQMLVVEIEQMDDQGNSFLVEYALANPKIVAHSVALCALGTGEGCLSVLEEKPGYVHRPLRVRIHAYDCISKQQVEIKAKGYLGVVLQHEIDHLHGVLFYDHINQNDPWIAQDKTTIID